MSEHNDDKDILEDIRTLENLLEEDDVSDASDGECDDNKDVPTYNLHGEELSEPDVALQAPPRPETSPDVIADADSVYAANQRLIATYKIAEEAIQARLNDCRKKQEAISHQIDLISRGGRANWRIPYVKAGMAYFKDDKLFPAPQNTDTAAKIQAGEFSVIYAPRPRSWTTRARNILVREVREQASEKTLIKMKRIAEGIERGNTNKPTEVVPKNWNKFGYAGPAEFDWMKISIQDLKSRYSWKACWAMWNLQLNDDINHAKWTSEEDEQLLHIAESHAYQDWNSIAEDLGSGRSCYQCFVRHCTLCPPSFTKSIDIPWSPLENEILIKCVEHLRRGDWIPWGAIASYINDRTKNQVYSHWKYNLDPALKKGRFTTDEDQMLLNGVEKFGTNFPRIASELLPERTSVQLNSRFNLLMLKTNQSYNSWTITEDRQLLSLYEEFGPQWSTIANVMKKDRTYLRHRYAALRRYQSKGLNLIHIRRKIMPNSTTAEDDEMSELENDNASTSNNVDVQLLRYFQNIQTPVSRPGRKAKYHTALQLESRTKQLVSIFKKLDAKFEIPENLNLPGLSEKDKQVLTSLREYMNADPPSISSEKIEQLRKRMFESKINTTDNDATGHFSPSASFSHVRKRGTKRQKAKMLKANANCKDIGIDLPTNVETSTHDFNLNLRMELDTPMNILETMNEEEKTTFGKLTSLVTRMTKDFQSPGKFEEKYLTSVNSAARTAKSSWESNIEINSPSISTHENIFIDPCHSIFIDPCYSTLLGYKCLLDMKKTYSRFRSANGSEESTPDNLRVTKSGKQAFYLLKTRLIRLFKYPIGLAQISDDKFPQDPLASFDSDCDIHSDKSDEDDEESVSTIMELDFHEVKPERVNNKISEPVLSDLD